MNGLCRRCEKQPKNHSAFCRGCEIDEAKAEEAMQRDNDMPIERGLEASARYPSCGFAEEHRTPIDDFYEWGGWDHLPKRGEE